MESARRSRCGRGRRNNCQKTSRAVGIRFVYSLAKFLQPLSAGANSGFFGIPPKSQSLAAAMVLGMVLQKEVEFSNHGSGREMQEVPLG